MRTFCFNTVNWAAGQNEPSLSNLDAERKAVREKLHSIEDRKAALETELSKYPPMPRDVMTREEIQLLGSLDRLNGELARLTETYENLLLESSEAILLSLAEDSKRIKWLTIWLVVLTAVLSLGTILDVLERLGLMK
jgi:chromosome segregation ATPase